MAGVRAVRVLKSESDGSAIIAEVASSDSCLDPVESSVADLDKEKPLDVRCVACKKIGELGNVVTAPQISKLLHAAYDESDEVSLAACEALARLKYAGVKVDKPARAAAAAAALQAGSSKPHGRARACHELGLLGSYALPYHKDLMTATYDDDATIRGVAAVMVANLERTGVTLDGTLRAAVAAAVLKEYKTKSPEMLRGAIDQLGNLGVAAVPHLDLLLLLSSTNGVAPDAPDLPPPTVRITKGETVEFVDGRLLGKVGIVCEETNQIMHSVKVRLDEGQGVESVGKTDWVDSAKFLKRIDRDRHSMLKKLHLVKPVIDKALANLTLDFADADEPSRTAAADALAPFIVDKNIVLACSYIDGTDEHDGGSVLCTNLSGETVGRFEVPSNEAAFDAWLFPMVFASVDTAGVSCVKLVDVTSERTQMRRLRHKDAARQVAAFHVLGRLGTAAEPYLVCLLEAMYDFEHPEVQRAAVNAVGSLKAVGVEAVEVERASVAGVALKSPDKRQQMKACEELSILKTAAFPHFQGLIEAACRSPDVAVQKAAVLSLELVTQGFHVLDTSSQASVAAVLVQELKRPQPQRACACRCLGHLGPVVAAPYLRDIVEARVNRSSDTPLVLAADEALANPQIFVEADEPTQAAAAIAAASAFGVDEVQQLGVCYVLGHLGKHGLPYLDDLEEYSNSAKDDKVRQAAADAIRRLMKVE